MTDAVQTVPGTDPDRASYQIAVETAQDLVTAPATSPGRTATSPTISAARSWRTSTARAGRVCARKVKSPLSRRNKHPVGKPRTSKRITTITAQVHAGNTSTATRRPQRVTTASGP